MDIQYKKLLREILSNNKSEIPSGREGMPNTKSDFGLHAKYKLSEVNFNICTAKEVKFSNITSELLWFMKGITNVDWLNMRGNYIWNEDAHNYYQKVLKTHGTHISRRKEISFKHYENMLKVGVQENALAYKDLEYQIEDLKYKGIDFRLGDCGKQYGWLWRNNDGTDQLVDLIINLKRNPFSRRHVLSAWNIRTLDEMALPACHSFVVFKVEQDKAGVKYLNCHLTQRSGDMFLGVPYNISSYSLLTIMLARVLGYELGDFSHVIVDAHIYVGHMEAVETYLESEIQKYPLLDFSSKYLEYEKYAKLALENRLDDQKLLLTTINNWINTIDYKDIQLKGYIPTKRIKATLYTGK